MKMLKLLLIFCLVLGMTSVSFAVEAKRTGKIIELDGTAEVLPVGGGSVPARIGMILNEGDTLKTAKGCWAVLSLEGTEKATVEVEENTQLLLSELMEDVDKGMQKTLLDLAIGKILIRAQKLQHEKSKFEIKTPTSVVGVRGTTFEVEVEGLD